MAYDTYYYTPLSPGYDRSRIPSVAVALRRVMREEFPDIPEGVEVVADPWGWLRITKLRLLDEQTEARLLARADDVFFHVMSR